jgi:hypothetical protein
MRTIIEAVISDRPRSLRTRHRPALLGDHHEAKGAVEIPDSKGLGGSEYVEQFELIEKNKSECFGRRHLEFSCIALEVMGELRIMLMLSMRRNAETSAVLWRGTKL